MRKWHNLNSKGDLFCIVSSAVQGFQGKDTLHPREVVVSSKDRGLYIQFFVLHYFSIYSLVVTVLLDDTFIAANFFNKIVSKLKLKTTQHSRVSAPP